MGGDGVSDVSAGAGEWDRSYTSGSIARSGACGGQRLLLTMSYWRLAVFQKVKGEDVGVRILNKFFLGSSN